MLGIGSTALGVALYLTGHGPERRHTTGWILFKVLTSFNLWFWVLAFLGLARRFLSFESRALPYSAEATYPFYVLHQTVLVAVGFHVMRWPLGVTARFLIVNVLTILFTLALYDIAVRRTRVTRFLFGMRPRPCRRAE